MQPKDLPQDSPQDLSRLIFCPEEIFKDEACLSFLSAVLETIVLPHLQAKGSNQIRLSKEKVRDIANSPF